MAEAYREPVRARAVLKGLNPCLSGFENKAEQMLSSGQSAEKTAKFVLCAVLETVSAMTAEVFRQHGRYPVVYAGGVMSNRFLKNELQNRFDGLFCEPQLSGVQIHCPCEARDFYTALPVVQAPQQFRRAAGDMEHIAPRL